MLTVSINIYIKATIIYTLHTKSPIFLLNVSMIVRYVYESNHLINDNTTTTCDRFHIINIQVKKHKWQL